MLVDVLRKVLPVSVKQGLGLWTVSQAGRAKWLAYPYYLLLCGKLPRGLEIRGKDCRVRYMKHNFLTPRDGIMAAIDIFQDKVYEKLWSPKKEDTVIDVGAYVGMFAVRASKLVGRGGQVIAIEPAPANIPYIKANTKGINNIKIIEEAVSDEVGMIPLYVSKASPCHSIEVKHGEVISVKTETLDILALRLKLGMVDFVKIDAEGAELSILRGAERMLSYDGIKLAIASYHDLANGEAELPYVVAFLRERGFNYKVVSGYVYADRVKKPMRIAIVNDTVYPYSKGGAQKRTWEVARRLAQRGHDVHWYGMKYWGGGGSIVLDGITLHGVCLPIELYTDGRRSIKQAIIFGMSLIKPLLKGKYDIVDCSIFPYFPCFAAKLYAVLKRRPLVITWFEVWGNYWYEYLGWRGFFGKMVEKLATKLPTYTIADSSLVKDELIGIGMNGDNVKVIPDGADIELIEKTRPANKGYDVLYAGRLLAHKNVDVLIEAVSQLPDITCGIIGDGPERDKLEQIACNRVEFLGFLENTTDIYAYMKASKVFAFPSTREGSPLAIPEANACGMPVIATDWVEDGMNGYLCKLDSSDMAQKILLAIKRRDSMTQRCKDYANQFDWEIIVDRIEATYKEVLK